MSAADATGGDPELTALCRREWPRLVGALDLLTGDLQVAEDLAQETLARACRDWDRVRLLESPGGWCHRVALNLGTSHLRRRLAERRARARESAGWRPDHRDPDAADRVAVRAALVGLPRRQRAVLVARYYLDCSVEETARLLHLPEGTVKTHTRRGLAALRTALGEPALTEVPDARTA